MKKLIRFLLGIVAVTWVYAWFEVINSLRVEGPAYINGNLTVTWSAHITNGITDAGGHPYITWWAISISGTTSLKNRITVSHATGAVFSSIKAAFDRIASHDSSSYEILVDAGEWEIDDTITISSSYPLSMRWLWYDVTLLVAAPGLKGKPMFDVKTDIDFNAFSIDGSTLDTYGDDLNEDGFNISDPWHFIQLNDIWIYGYNRGIDIQSDSELRVFNWTISDNKAYGVYISGGDYRSAMSDYDNNHVNAYLYAGSGNMFSTEHDSYYNGASWTIDILYNPIKYVNYVYIAIFDNSFQPWHIPFSGADFSTERDADIEVNGNIGVEDFRPHAKVNLINGTSSYAYSANTRTPLKYTISNSYTKKFAISNTGTATFLSSHEKSLMMGISIGLQATVNNPTNIDVAIVKNGDTANPYAIVPLTTDQANRTFNVSTNVYLTEVNKNDYFQIYVKLDTAKTLIIKSVNWFIESR